MRSRAFRKETETETIKQCNEFKNRNELLQIKFINTISCALSIAEKSMRSPITLHVYINKICYQQSYDANTLNNECLLNSNAVLIIALLCVTPNLNTSHTRRTYTYFTTFGIITSKFERCKKKNEHCELNTIK